MSRHNHQRKLNWRDYLLRTIVLLASTAILVLCMPRDGYTKYTYTMGEPWEDAPIIAKSTFMVEKPKHVLDRERDSLQQYYEPYYELDPEVEKVQIQAFRTEFQEHLSASIPEYYLDFITERLHELYTRGVVTSEEHEMLKSKKIRTIKVYAQNISSERAASEIFPANSEAYNFLIATTDSARFDPKRLKRCNLNLYITQNLAYDAAKSQQQHQEVDEMLVPYMGQIQAGQKVVDRGQIVDEYTYQVLQSLESYESGRSKSTREQLSVLGGQTLYAFMMMLTLLFFFQQFRSDYLDRLNSVLLIMSMTLIFPILTYTLVKHNMLSVYLIPYCILPIFLRIFLDSRTAFLSHMVCIMLSAVALKHPYEFLTTQTLAGLTAIYSLRQLQQRSELFRAVVAVVVVSLITYLCIDLLHSNFFNNVGIDPYTYIYIGLNGLVLLISYSLLFPVERILGFTSTVTLVELSNINNQLLRRLSEEAPGTFQHSMQVANLAAEVANKIGAKSLLVRTGALYHDIGKLKKPEYYTENQSGTNPHDGLTPQRSASHIISHVKYGLEMADKHKLPQIIRDFIRTHHGRSMAKYFYITYANEHPDQEIDPTPFTYPGPNPWTPEQAILMMADAVEAASRSLPEYTEENVNALVDRIIDGQRQEGYFDQCPITFEEITTAKAVFKEKLRTVYHTRISYPELKTAPATEEPTV